MELSRMFPAFKPHEIGDLPTRYYLKLRDYYIEQRDATRRAIDRASGIETIEWDGDLGRGGPT